MQDDKVSFFPESSAVLAFKERLGDERWVKEVLLEDRRKQDFIGRHLPFTLADDPTFEPVRYEIGDDWLDLMVLYCPDWGWEVHVLETSSEEVSLSDVYRDLRNRVRAELQVDTSHAATTIQSVTLKDILVRVERLEQGMTKQVDVQVIESPYLTAAEAAAYLRINVNALYSLVERRKLRPLPGHRRYRFTREMLDDYLKGS